MKARNRVTAIVTVLGAVVGGCSSASSDTSGFAGSAPRDNGSADGGASNASGSPGGGGGTSGTPLPPETKAEQTYRAPVATGHVVWIANPSSGRVAYITAATLDVRTVEAGNGPTYLAAVPDPVDDVAIVQNVLSHDATLFRDHDDTLTTRTFPITANANAWAVAPSGRFAIAWTDASAVAKADPTQGFQDIAVLDLSIGGRPATNLAVGYRPVSLAFSADGTRAFAVTQDGISVIDLLGGTQPTVKKNFALSDDPAEDPGTRDVSFTPDGAFALVRRDGQAALTVVALDTGTRTTVTLPSPPTDLTLSPAGDFALAVLRDSSTVAVLPLPAIAAAPTGFTLIPITGEVVGRAIVTKKGDSALLFTTVADAQRMTVLTFRPTPTFRVLKLHAPVLAVFPTDDEQSAIVLHRVTPTAGSTVRGAFSVVPLVSDLPAKIVPTEAAPTGVALAPAGDRALVTVRDDGSRTYGVYLAKMPSLEVVPYTLASPPSAVGIAAASARGYVAQEHPEGRITFVDLADGRARTITGFELGARVVDGSNP